MSTVLNSNFRRCDILTNGPLAELNFVVGPVYNCKLTTPQIIKLVKNGKIVKEINPSNPNEKVQLTVLTCQKSPFNRGDVKTPANNQVEKVVEPEKQQVISEPEKTILVEKEDEKSTDEQEEKLDEFQLFLRDAGLTAEEYRKLSRQERRRIREEVSSKKHAEQEQKVSEQIAETVTTEVQEETPVTIPDNQFVNENSVVESVSTEEAVISADM